MSLAVPPNGMKFIKGEPIDFASEFGQKVFVLEFWATWCPPCRNSIPHLSEMQQKYKNDVTFVGITSEDVQTATDFVKQMGNKMEYTVCVDNGVANTHYMQQFGIQGIPHAFIVGKDRKIAWHGHPMEGEFNSMLQKAIKQPNAITVDPNASRDTLLELSVKDLKSFLASKHIDYSLCVEKAELVDLIKSKM